MRCCVPLRRARTVRMRCGKQFSDAQWPRATLRRRRLRWRQSPLNPHLLRRVCRCPRAKCQTRMHCWRRWPLQMPLQAPTHGTRTRAWTMQAQPRRRLKPRANPTLSRARAAICAAAHEHPPVGQRLLPSPPVAVCFPDCSLNSTQKFCSGFVTSWRPRRSGRQDPANRHLNPLPRHSSTECRHLTLPALVA